MIPKTIHYCWFGKNAKPALALKCMKSWEKRCKGYNLIEWNEDSFDINSAPEYVRQAYEAKKWAFVTDYVRLQALYYYGGIYMDTDVEVLKSLDDLLRLKGFSGFEDFTTVPTGIMASEKGHPVIREWMNEYDNKKFVLEDGSLNLETNVVAITRSMKNHGLITNNTLQTIEGFTFYPKDYFCPKSYHDGRIYKTNNTYTIHHFAGSWKSPEERKEHEKWMRHWKIDRFTRHIKNGVKAIVGENIYIKIKNIVKDTTN